jgi:hypothetical protein
VRVSKVLKAICGFTCEFVIMSAEVVEGIRPALWVQVRAMVRKRGRCRRCGELAAWFDNGRPAVVAASRCGVRDR